MTTSTIDILKEKGEVIVKIKNLGVGIKRQRAKYVVYSPGLNVLGYSNRNLREALSDFEENLKIFFSVHLSDDTLRETLLSSNWKSVGEPSENFGTNNDNGLQEKDYEIAIAA